MQRRQNMVEIAISLDVHKHRDGTWVVGVTYIGAGRGNPTSQTQEWMGKYADVLDYLSTIADAMESYDGTTTET